MHLYPLLLNSVLMACSNCMAHGVFLQCSGRHNTHLTDAIAPCSETKCTTLCLPQDKTNLTKKKKKRAQLVACITTRFCSVTAITVISAAC